MTALLKHVRIGAQNA